VVRRSAAARPTVLRAGDLVLDPARLRVTRAGTEVPLTPREFELLAYLMRNADVVLSKTSTLHAMWDEAFDGDVDNVEIYVSYLRRKIDLPFGRSSIRTVRGAGHAFPPDGG
jgi:two-component system OmpR family response regulator